MAEETGRYEVRQRLFRGMLIEDLKKLDTREFSKHLKSRQRRAVLRGFNVIENFVKSCQKEQARGKQIKTHKRDLVIVPALVDMTICIHNGHEFFPVKITQEMLGHRLGEFSMTRKAVKHGAAGVGATKSSSKLSVK